MRAALLAACLMLLHPELALSQTAPAAAQDSDHDGLSDDLEAALLTQFAPHFMVSREDCSVRPAQFRPERPVPTVLADDATIYGQASPRKGHAGEVELHFYHLWRRDCGEIGHRLDAEHVSVLVETGQTGAERRALFWYAAAHEDTLCDASQVTRAETIHADDHGVTVWISDGKHASFLNDVLCTHGCGGDRCDRMEPLHTAQIINLGERSAPMNGIAWLGSPEWPLAHKLERSDFAPSRLARLERLPDTDIAWANPSKRPAQGAILGANAGLGGAATGARAPDTALVVAHAGTASALRQTTTSTTHAHRSSSRNVLRALKKSARKTGEVVTGNPEK